MSHLLHPHTLRRAVLGGFVAAAALAPAAADAAYSPGTPGAVGTAVSYTMDRTTWDSISGPSGGDSEFYTADSVKSESGTAAAHSPGWPLGTMPFPPPLTACTGGCATADAVAAGRADATGTIETFTRANASGWGGHEGYGNAFTRARIDDTITVSKATVVTLRGRLVGELARHTSNAGDALDASSILNASVRVGQCGFEGCDKGWFEEFRPQLSSGQGSAPLHLDEQFEVDIALPAGKSPVEAVLSARADAMGEENGSGHAKTDAHRNDDGDRLTFEIVVPDDVVVTSGSGKLPIIGGKKEQQDTTPPAIQVPNGITTNATSPSGDVVTYTVQATDASGTPTLVCSPKSGSMFAVGETTVTCVATDAAGNSATASFTVTVLGVADQLANLRTRIVQIGGAARTQLLPHLKEKCNSMATLRHQIGNLVRKGQLSQALADELLISVNRIAGALGC